ncbi:DJ-1/PfpI family protein [Falsiroseomonas sp. HW251]|uniref:GFA family protein n=1 Tax=Falsiroseomonas sp. HW251 TaxID=3390998 RepID=UPI003D31D3EB
MSLKDPNPVDRAKPKRIALVLANPAVSSTTGWPVGFWWSELTHPWLAFHERGYEVELFSPGGGRCEADAMSDPRDPSGYSSDDIVTMGFIATPRLAALVEATKPVEAISLDAFDAIVVAGGQAPMFTFEGATALHARFAAFLETGKVAAALCHGTAILRYAKLSNGEYVAKGRTVTGFANVEEDFADSAVWSMGALPRDRHVMPWRIEDALKALGANYIQVGLWRGFAVRDGNLVTGQQNFSGAETARAVIGALGGMKPMPFTGRCHCGGVRYRVAEAVGVIVCHCRDCQQMHGNANAMLAAAAEAVTLDSDATLVWYASSPAAERGFCSRCGGRLFKRLKEGGRMLVSAGTVDPPTGMTVIRDVWAQSKGDWYEIPPRG